MIKFNLVDTEYLMQIIKNNGNIGPLLKKFDYISIAAEIKSLIEKNFANYEQTKLELTDKGIIEHERIKKILKMKHSGWISEKTDDLIPQIDKYDIYLPPNIDSLK